MIGEGLGEERGWRRRGLGRVEGVVNSAKDALEGVAGALASLAMQRALVFEVGGEGEGNVEEALLWGESRRHGERLKAQVDKVRKVAELVVGEVGAESVCVASDG